MENFIIVVFHAKQSNEKESKMSSFEVLKFRYVYLEPCSLPVWAIKLARLSYSTSMGNISRLWIWASGITLNKQNQKGRCRNCCLDMSYEVFRSDVRPRQNQVFRQCCRSLREMIMTQKGCPVRARPVCLPSAGWADSKPALYTVLRQCWIFPRPWQTEVICCTVFLNDFRRISRSQEEQDSMYSCLHIKDNCAFVLGL